MNKFHLGPLIFLLLALLFIASACRSVSSPGEKVSWQEGVSSAQTVESASQTGIIDSIETGRNHLKALAISILKGDPVRLSEPVGSTESGVGGSLFCMQESLCAFSSYSYRYDAETHTRIVIPGTVDARLPGPVWSLAWQSLADHTREYLLVDLLADPDNNPTASGFLGDDWFVFITEDSLPLHKGIHTIWRTENGTDYYEYGNNNSYPYRVTGAYILSEMTGFLCQDDLLSNESAGNFKLFGTFDGGRTWQDMGLSLPETYAGYSYATAFFPYFLGEKGIVFVCVDDLTDRKTVFFQTEDGGKTWSFGQEIGS
ncbi:MAG: hypothetical protein IKS35_06405 [Clostridia bacterium]|nr:hypothetical protein [Clostridia bacterium]